MSKAACRLNFPLKALTCCLLAFAWVLSPHQLLPLFLRPSSKWAGIPNQIFDSSLVTCSQYSTEKQLNFLAGGCPTMKLTWPLLQVLRRETFFGGQQKQCIHSLFFSKNNYFWLDAKKIEWKTKTTKAGFYFSLDSITVERSQTLYTKSGKFCYFLHDSREKTQKYKKKQELHKKSEGLSIYKARFMGP